MVHDVPVAATGQIAAVDVPSETAVEIASAPAPIEAPAADIAPVVPVAFAAPENPAAQALSQPRKIAARSPELDALIEQYAAHHAIPVTLLRRVVNRESTFNPAARNGPYWGLMQILPATARTMGYQGTPEGLLDAETNLIYAGKYLRGAYMVADGDHDLAVRYYSRGYYYDAKRRGMLEETGLRPSRKRIPETVVAQASVPRSDIAAPANTLFDIERPGAAFVPAP